MHQLFSTALSLFISPFNWIVVLVIAGYVLRKVYLRKICRVLALCIFLIFSNSWLLDWYANKWQPAPVIIDEATVFSCGIVAGGFGSPDASGNGYFNATADRFIQAAKLYKLGNITHILITGGNGKNDNPNFREGEWAKGELVMMGVPASVIFVEDKSNNTADNAMNARQMLDTLQLKPPYLLITSAAHVPRASLLFRQAGLAVTSFPCNYIAGRGSFNFPSSLLPQPTALSGWNSYLKETAGYLWYQLNGK